MGRTAHKDDLPCGKGKDPRIILGHHGNPAGHLPPLHGMNRAAVQQRLAFLRREDTVQQAEEGRFARAVRSQNPDEFPAVYDEIQIPEHPGFPVAKA